MNILLLIPPNKKGYIRDVQYGCWHEKKWIEYSWPPISLYYISAILNKSHKVKIIDGSLIEEKETLELINEFGPDFIVLSSGSYTIEEDASFANKIKCKKILYVLKNKNFEIFYRKLINDAIIRDKIKNN